jgi:peptidoglycan/xylan/chitin deacetylase (PgdA/CDA1 family)
MTRARAVAGVFGATTAVGAAAYWRSMSSFSQSMGPFPYRAATGERTIALTFDDGPNEPYTSQVADVLSRHDAVATFFQVGRCVQRHPEVTAALAAAGHTIGNHSLSHELHRCVRRADLVEEVEANQQILTDRLGHRPALYRPPWLLRTPALFEILAGHALTAVSGKFCHALEFAQPSAERIARRALAKAQPGAILIFHDGFDGRGGDRANTVAALRHVIDRLALDGYTFTTVDQLLGVAPYQQDAAPVPGPGRG